MKQLAHLTANGSSTPITWAPFPGQDWSANIQVYGTLDGTITIEASLDGTNFSPVDGGDFTTALMRLLKLKTCSLRATLSGATTTDVYVVVS